MKKRGRYFRCRGCGPEQISGALIQAASLKTINGQAHVVMRIAMFGQTNDFVRRYGDLGDDEFTDHGSTIPQRLLLMNGNLVKERTQPNPFASTARIAVLTGRPEKQVEAAYLAILRAGQRPTSSALRHANKKVASASAGKPLKICTGRSRTAPSFRGTTERAFVLSHLSFVSWQATSQMTDDK